MSEAPKKIWVNLDCPDPSCLGLEEQHAESYDLTYIRADIVEELRGIVKDELSMIDCGDEHASKEWTTRLRAALAKLEET